MRSKRQLKQMFEGNPNMKELIESLWREYPGLYNEKYDRTVGELVEPWLLNIFNPDVEFGQALGMDHSINGNQSTAIGIGAISRAFRELVLGSYPTEDPLANPDEWKALDRLLTVGKGIDDANREDALILFKSGLLKLFNAIKIGKFEHGEELPEAGTLQYTSEKSLELWEGNQWNPAADKHFRHTQGIPATVWTIAHNLGKYPSVTVTDTSGAEYEGDVQHIDLNNMVLTFSAAFAGYADLN